MMKLLKPLTAAAAALFACATPASAYVITLNADSGGGGYVDSGGNALTTGTSAYGFFTVNGTLTGAAIDPSTITAGDLAAIQASWVEVASTTTFGTNFSGEAFVQNAEIASNPDGQAVTPFTFSEYTGNIAGKEVYNLVTSGGEYGVFQSNVNFDSGADALNNVTIASFWEQNTPGTAVSGHAANLVGGGGAAGDANQLITPTAIPEPSTGLLIVLGGAAAFLMRRRLSLEEAK